MGVSLEDEDTEATNLVLISDLELNFPSKRAGGLAEVVSGQRHAGCCFRKTKVGPKSNIYRDFSEEIKWIQRKLVEEYPSYPDALKPIAEEYLARRTGLLQYGKNTFDKRIGKPSPYLPLWLADSLRYIDKDEILKLTLAYTYATLSVSARDDVFDASSEAGIQELICVSEVFLDRYLRVFDGLFNEKSPIWRIITDSERTWRSYEIWNFSNRGNERPLSPDFLKKSSSYLVAITFPILASIAILSDNETRIPDILKFLETYCAAFKIIDDMRDWRIDLGTRDYNNSTILLLLKGGVPQAEPLSETDVINYLFLNRPSVELIYESIFSNLEESRQSIGLPRNSYIYRFITEQMNFHSEEKRAIIHTMSMFNRI